MKYEPDIVWILRAEEKHGGRIWAETAGPGKGTTIFFTLPSSSKNCNK